MNPIDQPAATSVSPGGSRIGRRDILRMGGMTISFAAIVAACGDNRTGDSAPGRVGNAPVITSLTDYAVTDAVLLRTASSLELTAVSVYNTAKGLGVFEGGTVALVDRLIANHDATAATMGTLTVAAGGTAWTDTNPWIMERAIEPMLAAITESDDPARDVTTLAISLENLAAATHQSLASLVSTSDQRLAVIGAASQESRHSAALVLDAFGTANRFSPALVGEEVSRAASGVLRQYAITSTFGSVAQIEAVLGVANENGTRRSFLLATPAANSFIYEELSEA